MNKAKKIIIIVLSCVVVLGGIYFALRTLKQKNQNSKTAGVYAVSDIGYDASDMWDNSTLSGNVTVNSEQKVYVGKTQSVSLSPIFVPSSKRSELPVLCPKTILSGNPAFILSFPVEVSIKIFFRNSVCVSFSIGSL